MNEIKPEQARELWVEALRSGKYKQGYGRLRTNDQFCCLAVGCEVYQEYVGDLHVKEYPFYEGRTAYLYSDHMNDLPEKVAEWFDITPNGDLAESLGGFEDNDPNDLVDCNDGLSMTFAQIADVVESGKLEGYYRERKDS